MFACYQGLRAVRGIGGIQRVVQQHNNFTYPRASRKVHSTVFAMVDDHGCAEITKVKVVGICGSIREGGFTKQALQVALQGASEAMCEVELIDLNDYQLYFCDGLLNQSKNAQSVQNDLAKLSQKVKEAKGIILATPEYHNSFSGVLKNALDLMGFEEFEGKVVGLVAVSGGAMGGVAALNGLRDIMRSLHSWVVPDQAGVPQAWQNLSNPKTQERLKLVGKQVGKYSLLLSNKKAQEFLDLIEKAASNPGGAKVWEPQSASAGN